MATTFSATLKVDVRATRKDTSDLGSAVETVQAGVGDFDAISLSLTTGTGSGQGNRLWSDERTVLSGANDDIDLVGGLTDTAGASFSFAKIRWVVIELDTPVTGVNLVFKGSTATNPAALWKASATADENIASLLVRTADVDGWTVTGGASDILRLTASGGNITYRIFVAGNS
jgi:hypothetical protein